MFTVHTVSMSNVVTVTASAGEKASGTVAARVASQASGILRDVGAPAAVVVAGGWPMEGYTVSAAALVSQHVNRAGVGCLVRIDDRLTVTPGIATAADVAKLKAAGCTRVLVSASSGIGPVDGVELVRVGGSVAELIEAAKAA